MTVGVASIDPSGSGGSSTPVFSHLWRRQLDRYPESRQRYGYLTVVVLSAIVLSYVAYVPGGVSPLILAHFKMSFKYYLYAQVIFGAVGAFASLIGSYADRVGRANIVVAGVGLCGLFQLAVVPAMPNKFSFVLASGVVGFFEGAVLVCLAAVVRDFTPQLKRATAMGFFTLGPVVGSLVVSLVANHTLSTWHSWQGQYYISGTTGLVMFVIALFTLRELSPGIRDQLMVSIRDRALVEARANGMDMSALAASTEKPWKQMIRWDVVGMSLGIALFLMVYYAAVGFFPIFLTTTFKSGSGFLSTTQANGIDTWFWAFDAAVLILVGLLSDRLRVRKPFMVIGGVGAIGATIALEVVTGTATTSYYTLVLICSIMASFLALAYAPWMATFTETVEHRNPALVGTGLAVWGYVVRIVVAVSALMVPIVVSSVTPIVNSAPAAEQAQALVTKNAKAIAIYEAHPALFAQLQHFPNPASIPPTLAGQALREVGVSGLATVSKSAPALKQLAGLEPQLAVLQKAIKENPAKWQHWWWVCVAGEVAFLPLCLLGRGRWSPKRARHDAEEHDRLVQAEMAKLSSPAESLRGRLAG